MQTSSTARCAAQDTELHRLRVLYQLLTDLSRADAVEEVYEAALSSLLSATDADRASILLFDDDGVMRFKASKGLSDDYQRAVTGHTPWRAGETGAEAIPVSDVRLDANLQAYVDIFDRERIRAMAFIPLALTRGVIGKFMLYYSEPHEFARDELELGRAIANHVALATERKHAEVALLASEQRLQAILDNSTTVVFLKDVEGRYILINRRFEELFHVTKSDIIGRTDHDVFRKEVADAFRANDQAVLTAAKALEMEEYAPHDDGVHTYISIKFPIYHSDGTALGVGGIATDVTARQKTENALRLAKEGLEQFAYAAAHDLQEPMRNVCLSAQLFARQYSDGMDSRANEYIKRMVDGSRRMQTLISDLLAYTRSLECTESAESCADADEVLREVLVNLRTAIESSNAEVTHDPLPVLPIHRAHLLQLLQNLISNALKYRREDPPRVHVSTARNTHEWIVTVADNGAGIREQYKEKIFGVFKRLHGPEVPGSGIGLAICARIAGHYNGRIWVDSVPGSGSQFSFALPRTDERVSMMTAHLHGHTRGEAAG